MTAPLRVSVADLGTNTVKILHAARHDDGTIERIEHNSNTIRLGAGIEETGRLEDSRIIACLDYLEEQEARGRELGSTSFIGVATEALRVVSNGGELLRRIADETSWSIRIITGEEEARLTLLGLREHVPAGQKTAIVDIGGGSTEIVVVENNAVVWSRSLALGSGRLSDRFFRKDPPGMEATALAFSSALDALGPLGDIPVAVETVLFSGGNGVFLQALVEQLFPGDPLSIHTAERLLQHLSLTPASDTVNRLGIMLARAQVFPAGVAIALAVLSKLRPAQVRGVPSGIQIGLIEDLARS